MTDQAREHHADWLVWRANLVAAIAEELEGFGYGDPEEGPLSMSQVIEKAVFEFLDKNGADPAAL